jgi:MFS family permease
VGEGVGPALMIPPTYNLVTLAFPGAKPRARYFGMVSGAGGLGAATRPLIRGLATSAVSWRASLGLHVQVVAWIASLARKITDPGAPRARFRDHQSRHTTHRVSSVRSAPPHGAILTSVRTAVTRARLPARCGHILLPNESAVLCQYPAGGTGCPVRQAGLVWAGASR